MKTRIISGVIGAIALIIFTVWGRIPMALMCAAVTILAIYEAYRAFGVLKHKALSTIGMLVFPLIYYIDSMSGNGHLVLWSSIFACGLFSAMVIGYPNIKFADVCKILTVSVAFTTLLSRLFWIRVMPCGEYLIWLAYVGAWITDTGAYFGGTFLGKRKLIPQISPKKTVEGSLCGIATTTVLFLIYGLILNAAGVMKTLAAFGCSLNIGGLILLGVLCGVVSQFGDLFASCLKREVGIKDFGNLMPGHGGALDRFDSVLFVAPAVYYFLWLTFIL